MSDPSISIESFEALVEKMKTMHFSVEWKVTCEFGPEWIGSSRTLHFYLGEYKVDTSHFIKTLEAELISLIPIPDNSKEYIIDGKGQFKIKDNALELDYYWEAAIPYTYPSETKKGTVRFSSI